MDAERISTLQARLRMNRTKVRTDDAARAALVLPFIQSLGYDIFDPEEVVPSFTRSQGRADFVVLDGEQYRMVISLAQDPTDLTSDRAVKLAECFSTVGATTAVLTDGSLFCVHTDADQPGFMDDEPLLSVDLGGEADIDFSVLTGLSKDSFDIASLASAAKSRRYDEAARRAVGDELADPSEGFIDIIGARMRAAGFEPQDDLFQLVAGLTLSSASPATATSDGGSPPVEIASGDDRVMTQDELLGYHIVRALAARHMDASRIVARPAQSYCAILLDDNNRKSIGRLHFNSQTVKYLGTFVDKKETRRPIPSPDGIYELDAFIVDRLKELDPKAFGLAETPASRSRDQQENSGNDNETSDLEVPPADPTLPGSAASEAIAANVEAPTAPPASSEDTTASVLEVQPSPEAPGQVVDHGRARMAFEDGIDLERQEPDDGDFKQSDDRNVERFGGDLEGRPLFPEHQYG
ncbi:hypothetical protein [Sphingomonas sp. 3-13AW]|uniref:hypothetical protein n=1 Tax=Sphingomonas sp. 3-13AW TaxID=3050450 RepID=UPI003BB6906D